MNYNDIIDILENVWLNLPDLLKNNLGLNELKRKFYELIEGKEEECVIDIRRDIYSKIKNLDNNDSVQAISAESSILFAIDFGSFDELSFALIYDNGYFAELISAKKMKENIYEDSLSKVSIKETGTSWQSIKSSSLVNGYFLSYFLDLHSYNKNNEPIEIPNIEETKDYIFSEFFNVPISKSRECRLNFLANIDYINNCKAEAVMKSVDESFLNYGIMFTSPFDINDLQNFILFGIGSNTDLEDNEDDCDEEYIEGSDEDNDESLHEEELSEFEEDKINSISDMLKFYTGDEGDFIMSYNLFINFRSHVLNANTLNTTGTILRKLNQEYTKYEIYLKEGNIIIIPNSITKEEAQELYKSDKSNEYISGLPEFFEINNTKKLK